MYKNDVDPNNSVIVIEAPGKKAKWFSNTGMTIIPTLGHFKDLPENEFGIDLQNYIGSFEVTKSGKRVAKELTAKCKGKDVYIATDVDREGDAIGYFVNKHIESIARNVYRIEVSNLSKETMVKGINNRYPFSSVDMNKIKGFFARRLGDRLVGYLLSPIASQILEGKYSVGRVQTVAVRLIKERDDAIKAFTVEKFWTIKGLYLYRDDVFEFSYLNGEKNNRFTSLAEARETIEQITRNGKTGVVSEIISKESEKKPQPPYITSTLQKDVGTKYNINVENIMEAAQKLYEGGYISYHRTDSFTIEPEFVKIIREYIENEIDADLLPIAAISYRNDKSQAEAHEPIRPLDITYTGEDLKGDQKIVYQAIRERTIASQMISARYNNVEIQVDVNGHIFFNKSKSLIEKGFLKYYKEAKKETLIAPLEKGDNVVFEDITTKEGHTTPPPRFTGPTLIEELDKREIGRPSTYISVVKKIQSAGYCELFKEKASSKKSVFRCLDKGHSLITYAMKDERFSWVCDYDMTKKMEDSIEDIVGGRENYKNFLKEIHSKMGFLEPQTIVSDPIENVSCPCCGSNLYDKGKVFVCEGYKYDKAKKHSTGCQFIVWKSSNLFEKDLTLEDFMNLLDGGTYTGKDDKKFQINQDLIESCSNGEINNENLPFIYSDKDFIDMPCPLCGDHIYKTQKQYVCNSSKSYKKRGGWVNEGCKFRVSQYSQYFETEIDEGLLQDLVNGKICKSNNDKEMIFDKENEFFIVDKNYQPTEKKEVITTGIICPKCQKGEFIETEKIFKCSQGKSKNVGGKWKNTGCQFMIYKDQENFHEHTISVDDLEILAKGQSITTANGNEIIMDTEGKYSITTKKD